MAFIYAKLCGSGRLEEFVFPELSEIDIQGARDHTSANWNALGCIGEQAMLDQRATWLTHMEEDPHYNVCIDFSILQYV